MADVADLAQPLEEALIESALSNRTVLPAKGQCYNCEEPLEKEMLFCDPDCCEDYEKRKRFKG